MSSPTDWYDTTDQQEYIGATPLSQNNQPKTGSENMDNTNITEERAMAAFTDATGFTPELPAVIEWVKQTLTDFKMPFVLGHDDQDSMMDYIHDWADTEVERNSYYLNALISADAGIWKSYLLDKYAFGASNPSGELQMDEVHTAFVYEVAVAMIVAYIEDVAKFLEVFA